VCHQIRCIASNASCAAKHAAAMGGPASGATARAHVVDAMAFGEITQVVPWDILALDCGQRLDDEQVCDPRLFKSHERWENVAKGARYVCVVRDPLDVFFSFYNFLPAYMGIAPGKITHEEFADAIFAGASHSGHVWAHFLGYWEQRAREDVLLVCFEDMKENLARVVERVARFILGDGNGNGDGNAASASAFEWTSAMTDEVCEKSEFEYMRSRAAQFDDHFVREEMWRRVRIDENEWGGDKLGGKVREGGEFEVIRGWEERYGADGPPTCQLLIEWHERFLTGVGAASAARRDAEAALLRMGFTPLHCWEGIQECVYWHCARCAERGEARDVDDVQ